jgi:proteasome lid subunit RPN8/RPN11
VRITQQMADELIAHAREDEPNECCGLIGGVDGEATRVVRVTNAAASPLRFEMHPQEQYDAMEELERAGAPTIAIYHSHTGTAAFPSQTDVNTAAIIAQFLGDFVYVIVSLEDAERPEVRGFWIRDGEVSEEPLDVV